MNVGGLSTACSAYCAPSKDSENAPNPHRLGLSEVGTVHHIAPSSSRIPQEESHLSSAWKVIVPPLESKRSKGGKTPFATPRVPSPQKQKARDPMTEVIQVTRLK